MGCGERDGGTCEGEAAAVRAAVGRCLYELGVSMVCCRASAAAAVDALACLNHGNEILRRCDLSAAATCVSAKRDGAAADGRCSGGSSDVILLDGGPVAAAAAAVVVAAAAAAAAAAVVVVTTVATTTTAAAGSTSARRPPPELGAAIDQSGSPSTGARWPPAARARSLARSLAAADAAAPSLVLFRCVRACSERTR